MQKCEQKVPLELPREQVCLQLRTTSGSAEARGPKTLKWTIKQAMALEVCGNVMRSRILEPSDTLRSSTNWFHMWPRPICQSPTILQDGYFVQPGGVITRRKEIQWAVPPTYVVQRLIAWIMQKSASSWKQNLMRERWVIPKSFPST